MIRAPFALTASAVVVFLVASVAIDRPPWTNGIQITDVPGYQRDGEAIADGAVPYRDVELEYPPGALLAFVPPALVAEDGAGEYRHYLHAFEWLMRACGVALIVLTAASLRAVGANHARLAIALALMALSPVLLGRLLVERFDLLPAAMVAGAVFAFVRQRDRVAFAVLGLAVATKLYPIVLAPVLLAAVWQRRGRRDALVCAAVMACVVVAVVAPFAVMGGDGLFKALRVQSTRPLHRETLGGGLLLVANQIADVELDWEVSHGSGNFVGALPDALASLSVLAQLVVLGWISWTAVRSRLTTDRILLGATVTVLAFVVFGKVLSPQFLIWLLPLVALLPGWPVPAGALAFAMVLSQAYFPRHYFAIARYEATPAWLIAGRNALLVVLFGVLVNRWRRSRHEPEPVA